MGTSRRLRQTLAALGVALVVVCAAPGPVVAQEWDPAAVISTYSAAFNAHDLDAALALFDQYGSATNLSGHHFEGQAGLREFLLDKGFGSPDARITTETLLVVANRAIWTYSCSCATRPTEVRLVLMNHNKISVFAEIPPPAAPARRADSGAFPWLIAFGLALGALAGALSLWRGHADAPIPRASQGRLLAGLGSFYMAGAGGGATSERVELPAASMTSFSNSDDRAGPWS